MKFDTRVTLLSLLMLLIVGCSNARPEASDKPTGVSYRDLELKDYDEMRALVREHTNKARKILSAADSNPDAERDARLELIKAERLIMSRPNPDNMVTKLIPDVRREMAEIGAYDDLLEAVTREGIQAFNGDLHLPVTVQTTFLFVLENLLSEMRPEVGTDPRQRGLVEQIRDAKIKVPDDVAAERKLKSMYLTESPSDQAKQILEAAGFKQKR